MAKKKNRGKKSTGTKSNSAAASENQSQLSTVGDKINVKTEEIGSTGNLKSENASVGLSNNAAIKDGCGHHSSAQTVGSYNSFHLIVPACAKVHCKIYDCMVFRMSII